MEIPVYSPVPQPRFRADISHRPAPLLRSRNSPHAPPLFLHARRPSRHHPPANNPASDYLSLPYLLHPVSPSFDPLPSLTKTPEPHASGGGLFLKRKGSENLQMVREQSTGPDGGGGGILLLPPPVPGPPAELRF